MGRRLGGWTAGALVLLLGCAGGYDTATQVKTAVDEFHDGFRWGAMGSMLPHIRPVDQETFNTSYTEAMRDVSMADYEVTRIQIPEVGDTALVWVELSWYAPTEMVVHSATIRERWVSENSNWYRAEIQVERGELPEGLAPPPPPEETSPPAPP